MGFTLIMFVLTDGYGLTSAIPLLFGSSMLLGVIIVYFMETDDRGNPLYIFSGVAVLFIAVIFNTVASSLNQKCQEKNARNAPKEEEEKKADEVIVPLVENPEPEKKVRMIIYLSSLILIGSSL